MVCLFGLFAFDRSIDLDAKTINEIRQLPWGRLVGDKIVVLDDLGQIARGLLEIPRNSVPCRLPNLLGYC
jgi:hypothetical protein